MSVLEDLAFDVTRTINTSYREVCRDFNKREVKKAVTAFARNLDRVVAMSVLFGGLIGALCIASTGKRRRMRERPITTDFDRLSDVINHLVDGAHIESHEKAQQGFELILSGMIVGSWTAFETLAGDLWEQCLNSRPEMGFKALGIKDAEDGNDDEEKRRMAFPFGLLRQWDYDLKARMGTLLRTMKKHDFGTHGGMARAYSKTFNSGATNIVFHDQTLRWLAATRHVIVHNGSIADDEFKKKVAEHPSLRSTELDKPVPINGVLVRELVDSASSQGVALISFMENWLNEN